MAATATTATTAAQAADEPSTVSFQDVTLEDPFSGSPAARMIRLGDLITRGPTVFLFLRHFA